jgi:DNA-binding NarL/FixJ family response regulator
VRAAVARHPNVVLRDQEMISRPELERNVMYRRAREVGAPLEQVMAVMLHIDDRWQSGLALYRDRRRPFTAHERGILRDITPSIVNAVRSCHEFSTARDLGVALELLLRDQAAAVVLIRPPAIEVARTKAAAYLIERWFAPHETRAGRLPEVLAALATGGGRQPLVLDAVDETFVASFVPLPAAARQATGMLVLAERSKAIPLPPEWRRSLTPRQQQITAAVLRGWDNKLVGAELDLEEATVKRHLRDIFDRLGVSSRSALIARAAERDRVGGLSAASRSQED